MLLLYLALDGVELSPKIDDPSHDIDTFGHFQIHVLHEYSYTECIEGFVVMC